MLDAMEAAVKGYYARPEYFKESTDPHSKRHSISVHNAF
jgi:hypothetical protein